MKILFISDTHSKHDSVEIPEGDILIHCGDFTAGGSLKEVEEFSYFMKKKKIKYKIVIAGNHDFALENEYKEEAEKILKNCGLIYLNNSGVKIEGLNIWGSPIQPNYNNWAFNRERGSEIAKYWNLIPEDTDILITHGPPYKILDFCKDQENVGCKELLKTVERIKPKVHCFGHIHEGYGTMLKSDTFFINACSLNEKYKYENEIIEINYCLQSNTILKNSGS